MYTKKPNKKSLVARDSLVNVLTGMGTIKDPKIANTWEKSAYDPALLDTLYSENWLARNCVDIPANEAVSKWREINTPAMKIEQVEAFKIAEKSMRLRQKVCEALRLARKYGGAAIYLAIEGQNVEKPLNVEGIFRGQKLNLIVLNRNEIGLSNDKIDIDEFSPNYGNPIFLAIKKTMWRVHASRFLVFRGPGVSDRSFGDIADRFWGKSVFDSSLIASIERCESAMDALNRSLEQATVDVLKIPDLFMKLADPEATRLLRARIAEGAMTKSVYRIAMIDQQEDFVRAEATGSLAAGAQILQMLLQIPAGATGIPVTKLLGISPGGLNATGESDLENYYGMLESIRQNDVEPALDIFDRVICHSLFGTEFADWAFEWPSFWSADPAEESAVTTARINGIVALVQNQILPEVVGLRQLFEDGIYSALTEEDVKAFEDMAGLEEAPAEMPAEAPAEAPAETPVETPVETQNNDQTE